MAEYYSARKDSAAAAYRFTPIMTRFSPVERNAFAQVLERPVSIFDIIAYFLQFCVEREQIFKQCKSCGRYFALSGYSTTEYCDRRYLDTGKTCREIGASVSYQRRVETEPAIAAYHRAYKRKFAHIRYKKITKDEFSAWSETARAKRDKCLAGEISLDDFKQWLSR
jgi:hypothetical protein